MSYDINFWKQKDPLTQSAQEVYTALCEGKPVEGLETLPVASIHRDLRDAFPEFDPNEEFPLVQLEDGSIEFLWSDQHFRFDLRGDFSATHINRLITIMAKHGCPLYDPQLNKRYDSENGTALGELPTFDDPTPEQKAETARIKQELIDKMQRNYKAKRGCSSVPAIVLLSVSVIILMMSVMF